MAGGRRDRKPDQEREKYPALGKTSCQRFEAKARLKMVVLAYNLLRPRLPHNLGYRKICWIKNLFPLEREI